MNAAIADGRSEIGKKYEEMRPWQKNLVDMKLDSDDVKRRLKDSCFGTDFNISILNT